MRPRSIDLAEEEILTTSFDLPEDSEPLPGLTGSPRVSHLRQQGHSFLACSPGEQSFLPPSPGDGRRCSTGVKVKEVGGLSISQASEVCKSLQFREPEVEQHYTLELEPVALQDTTGPRSSDKFSPINALGFQLPVIGSPPSSQAREDCRLSSDTFVTSPRPPQLSTIQEEGSRSQAEVTQERTRTPARPRRSNVSYTRQAIEDIVQEVPVDPKEQEDQAPGTGLLFISVSPQEKRKPEQPEARAGRQESKRSRPQPRPAPPVRVVRNPVPPKPTTGQPQTASKTLGARPKTSQTSKTQSVPTRPITSRAPLQPARRLQLAKKSQLVHHPNPFASRNMYYDDKWVEKQERGFTRWLNFMLTPGEGEACPQAGAVDVAKLWSQCTKDVKVPRAPTKEVMSMRAYTASRELNRLRRSACRLWQSGPVAGVVAKLELEIDKLRLVVRKDRNINRDVGMKQKLLQLVLSYNPLWLRVGLETVYGELLQLGNNSDVLGLTR